MTTEIEDALRTASEAVLSVVLPVVELATSILRVGWPVFVGIGREGGADGVPDSMRADSGAGR